MKIIPYHNRSSHFCDSCHVTERHILAHPVCVAMSDIMTCNVMPLMCSEKVAK